MSLNLQRNLTRNCSHSRQTRLRRMAAALISCALLTTGLCRFVAADPAPPLPPLHVSGKRFIDPSGNEIVLRGVNIGGWLVPEGWMCGDKQQDRFILERLEGRFGADRAAQLMNVWYDNWLTAADLDRIRSYGFNVVRVPFGFRNLEDAAGNFHRTANGHIDFSRFDWIVREAGKRGMYVIFDMHVWPGQQAGYSQISRIEPTGDTERRQAAEIWAAMARHFKGDATVAAFDLFNEPEGSPNDTLQRVSYEAIRKEDPNRIIIGQAMYYSNMKNPYWKNFVWSAHYPVDDKAGSVEEKVARWQAAQGITDASGVNVPIFMGEIKAPDDTQQSAADLVAAMKARDWSWAIWCYKAVNRGGWASFNYYGSSVSYDSAADSYDTLKTLWSTKLTQWQHPDQPVNYYETPWWIAGFRLNAGR